MGEPKRIEVVHESPYDELGNHCQFQAIALISRATDIDTLLLLRHLDNEQKVDDEIAS